MNFLPHEKDVISLATMRSTRGGLRDLNQPCQIANIKILKSAEFSPADLVSALDTMIADEPYLARWVSFQVDWKKSAASESIQRSLSRLVLWWWVQEIQVLTRSNLKGSIRPLKNDYFELVIPKLINPSEATALLMMIVENCNRLLVWLSGPDFMQKITSLRSEWAQRRAKHTWTKISWNTALFRDAADRNGIPWWPLKSGVDQFGWGARGRRLLSTHSDHTNVLSQMLAKHKGLMSEVLRDAGLPVARQGLATSLERCLELAREIGFPVVVKPAMEDFARGVSVNLRSEEDVKVAFERARTMGPVLVESHVHGREYRITVVHGQVTCAYERVGAVLTGDGIHTVAELIHALNAQPNRVGFPHGLAPVSVNQEILEILSSQGWKLESVPPPQSVIRLMDIPLIVNGGIPENRQNSMHPDNIDAIIRATRIIGLDIAGVDFIIPDISCSWLECESAILEVNSQPLLIADQICASTPDYFGELLKTLLNGGDGRLPAIAFVGQTVAREAAKLSQILLSQKGCQGVGVATDEGAWLDKERLALTDVSGAAARDVLLIDPATQFALIQLKTLKILNEGHPCDCYSTTVILELQQSDHDLPDEVQVRALADFIRRTTDYIAINIDNQLLHRAAMQVRSKKLILLSANPHLDMKYEQLAESCSTLTHDGSEVRLHQHGKTQSLKIGTSLLSANPMSLLAAIATILALGLPLS